MFHVAGCRLPIMRQPTSHHTRKSQTGLILIFLFLLGAGAREYWSSPLLAQSQDWEPSIRKFEADDKVNPPKAGEIVFTGASSIRRWDTLRK
jgi:hypothetical protein